jgi:uncharacterized protein YjbI with pentapeptide repeats
LYSDLDEVAGLILTNRDLRGADFRNSVFPKGDLRGANLKGANLAGARVFAVNFSSFSIFKGESCLDDAQQLEDDLQLIKPTYVCRTNLQGADLRAAQLQGADLKYAQLQGARLWDAQLQGADLKVAQLQGASLWAAQLQGADLQHAELQGADLFKARLQGSDLWDARLQGADLSDAELQGADLQYAELQGANIEETVIGSADFTGANLALSNLRELSWSPLDEKTYEELERVLTHAISDEHRRADRLKQIKGAVGRPAQLKAARSADQVLCDDVNLFPSCLTQEKITDYAHARASFLVQLGCHNARIAYGIVTWHMTTVGINRPHSAMYLMLIALGKSFTASPEKNCPGWADLPGALKDSLRKLAAAEQLAP